jgi:hypothetical protein
MSYDFTIFEFGRTVQFPRWTESFKRLRFARYYALRMVPQADETRLGTRKVQLPSIPHHQNHEYHPSFHLSLLATIDSIVLDDCRVPTVDNGEVFLSKFLSCQVEGMSSNQRIHCQSNAPAVTVVLWHRQLCQLKKLRMRASSRSSECSSTASASSVATTTSTRPRVQSIHYS